MTDLKPCPFCGATPELSPSHIYDEYDCDEPVIYCDSCGITMTGQMVRFSEDDFENKEVADQDLIYKWNKRV